jgi:hypothetical protein
MPSNFPKDSRKNKSSITAPVSSPPKNPKRSRKKKGQGASSQSTSNTSEATNAAIKGSKAMTEDAALSLRRTASSQMDVKQDAASLEAESVKGDLTQASKASTTDESAQAAKKENRSSKTDASNTQSVLVDPLILQRPGFRMHRLRVH